jgi:hypothetical protein
VVTPDHAEADIRINYGGGSLVSDSITLAAEEIDAAWGKLLAAMEEKFLRDSVIRKEEE